MGSQCCEVSAQSQP